MMFCRLATAVFVSAIIAGHAAAQVTDATTPPPKSPVVVDPIVPKTADEPVTTPIVQVSPVPEPGSILLLTSTGAGAGWVTYWRRKWRAEPTAKGPSEQP